MLINAVGAYSASQPLEPMAITRRDPGPQDVTDRHRLLRRLPLRSPPGRDRSGRGRCTPACRGMKLWGGW